MALAAASAAATAAPRDRLVLALLPAAALHALLIFGITFNALTRESPPQQLEVTLVQAPDRATLTASHLAQADQRGSGERADRDRAPRAAPALPVPTQQAEQRASRGAGEGGDTARALLTARRSEQRTPAERGETAGGNPADRLAALQRRLAALEASVQDREDASSTAPRVRTLTAVSAKSAVEAEYLQAWRERLETVGNAYYPRASLRYGLYGALRMRVILRSDGSLERVDLLDSSGYAVLDEAALKIVRMAAPYAPFPPALREKADKLEIIRTWDFAPVGG